MKESFDKKIKVTNQSFFLTYMKKKNKNNKFEKIIYK
jgi:hypothetical protein